MLDNKMHVAEWCPRWTMVHQSHIGKSHPQLRLYIVLWAQDSAHSNWSGYVGCVIRRAQHVL